MILKFALMIYVKVDPLLMWLRRGKNGASYAHGNKISFSIKGGVSGYELLKKHPTPRRYE
jgi:hypothetical protein